jgi:GPH family glycoside/pentoside/hexuronide:cation symporter
MKHALKISDELSFVFMAVPLVIAVAATPFWVKVSEKAGKQKAYIISAIYFLVPLFLCLVITRLLTSPKS